MGKIPCRLCGSCGRYNDLSVQTCQCGADLANVPGRLVDEPIPPEQWGEIDRSLPVFVQKCSACGAENFTTDPARPIRSCYNCHKARVALVVPIPYEAEQAPPDSREQPPLRPRPSPFPPPRKRRPIPGRTTAQAPGVPSWKASSPASPIPPRPCRASNLTTRTARTPSLGTVCWAAAPARRSPLSEAG